MIYIIIFEWGWVCGIDYCYLYLLFVYDYFGYVCCRSFESDSSDFDSEILSLDFESDIDSDVSVCVVKRI